MQPSPRAERSTLSAAGAALAVSSYQIESSAPIARDTDAVCWLIASQMVWCTAEPANHCMVGCAATTSVCALLFRPCFASTEPAQLETGLGNTCLPFSSSKSMSRPVPPPLSLHHQDSPRYHFPSLEKHQQKTQPRPTQAPHAAPHLLSCPQMCRQASQLRSSSRRRAAGLGGVTCPLPLLPFHTR